MPDPEPIPPQLDRAARAWARYKRLMKRIVLATFAAIGLSLLALRIKGEPAPVDLYIATLAGIGLAVLLGTALVGLAFVRGASGPNHNANGKEKNDEQRQA